MALKGFREFALRVMTSLFEAALHFHDYRLATKYSAAYREREQDEPVRSGFLFASGMGVRNTGF